MISQSITIVIHAFKDHAYIVCRKPGEIDGPVIVSIVYLADCFVLVKSDCIFLVKISAKSTDI